MRQVAWEVCVPGLYLYGGADLSGSGDPPAAAGDGRSGRWPHRLSARAFRGPFVLPTGVLPNGPASAQMSEKNVRYWFKVPHLSSEKGWGFLL